MTRWKASGIHLLVSLTVIGTITGLIYLLWFPHALILIAGMDRLLLTMLMVDIVAGPLLTLIVFKAHDVPQTRRDLTVIGLLQAGFLLYALHTTWISRPVYLVWSVDKMYLLYANDIDEADLADTRPPIPDTLSWFGPRLHAIVLPGDAQARSKVFEDIIRRQTSLERLPQYYGDYDSQRAKILRASLPAEAASIPKWLPEARLAEAVAASGRKTEELRLVGIESARAASMMLIDAETARPVRTLRPPSIQEEEAAAQAKATDADTEAKPKD